MAHDTHEPSADKTCCAATSRGCCGGGKVIAGILIGALVVTAAWGLCRSGKICPAASGPQGAATQTH